MTEKKLTVRDRLVGGLSAGGGALALGSLISYLLWRQHWNLNVFIVLEAIGISLFTLGIIIYKKGKRG